VSRRIVCRLSPTSLGVGTSLGLIPWGVNTSIGGLNQGFQVVNGQTEVYVPQSGLYRVDAALSALTNQPEAAIIRLIARIGGQDRIATGARARGSSLTQGPAASAVLRINIGQPVQVLGSFTGGTAADLAAHVSHLSLELLEAV